MRRRVYSINVEEQNDLETASRFRHRVLRRKGRFLTLAEWILFKINMSVVIRVSALSAMRRNRRRRRRFLCVAIIDVS